MPQKKSAALTQVEALALEASPFADLYPPEEKIRTIVVENFPALGKLAAMRFLEWVQNNPGGMISLPTGKTPEHFIKWVERLLATWDEKATRKLLEEHGVDPGVRPRMDSLHFVQIDEFYPINPTQHNSFFYYVNRYYLEGFGLDPKKALLIDCSEIGLPKGETLDSIWPDKIVDLSLRYRPGRSAHENKQKQVIEQVDQWCQAYEDKIRQLGGIGFFLGGIGPDGHIGFNVRGSDHHSTTRLTPTNYETQAAAATDLGGIENSRTRLVITIGLGTMTHNPDCAAIIIAAGEAKAKIVADAIQSDKHVLYPGSALQSLPNARFYITLGAAKLLKRRRLEWLKQFETVSDAVAEMEIVDLAVKKGKRVADLTAEDFRSDARANIVLKKRTEGARDLARLVSQSLNEKICRGTESYQKTRFLHTEPHHDDLMLGYLPYIVRNTREPSNAHYFACLTSGFTAVTNAFMREQMLNLKKFLSAGKFNRLMERDYFDPDNINGRKRDVWRYLDGVAANQPLLRQEGGARRLLRNLIQVFDEFDLQYLGDRINELINYFETQYPGKKDLPYIQRLKGMNREWEAECLWGYFGWSCEYIRHLNLGFYTGDVFTEEPTMDRDVAPVLALLEEVRPDIITVALDPEASGPDTHYKVLQAITEALKQYEKKSGRSDLKIWGYRNVWYRFHPAEANLYVPVSLNMFSIMQSAFMNTFLSQKDASFPSYEHDGPFSELAQKIQVQQYQMLKTCLGREWFYEHKSAMIRATRGLVFLKEMSLPEFYARSRELRQMAENR